jgi:hypothetical protein
MITAPNGDVYATNAREHSLFKIGPSGNYLKLGGALNYVDNENNSRRTVYGFSLNPTQMSSICQEAFGGECGSPQIRNT